MLRYFFAILFVGLLVVLSLAGFRGATSTRPPIEIFPDMDDQPKYRPQHENSFFADGRANRPPVPGTVPQGYDFPGAYYYTSASNSRVVDGPSAFSGPTGYADTGRIGGMWGDGIPLPVSDAVMARGQERFDINCAICHGHAGLGNGIIKKYGLTTIATLQDDRIRSMPDGEIFNTITHGKGNMGAYGSNIAVADRWAIIAYMRALQRSQRATEQDVPPQLRAQLDEPAEKPASAATEGGAQ